MFQAPLWCSPPLLLPPCLWSRQNLWDSANPGVSPWKKSWGVARQLSTWWTVENGKVVVCKMKIVYNSVLSIDSFSLISHTYQCPHAIQICGFTPVKIAKKRWKHRHLRVGPISKFRPWVLNFPEKDPTFLTSLGSIKPTAGWPSPNLSICPAHRHQKSHQLSGDPYHRKQGIKCHKQRSLQQIALKWQPPSQPCPWNNQAPILFQHMRFQPKLSKRFKKTQKNECELIRPPSELNLSAAKKKHHSETPHVHSQQTKTQHKRFTNAYLAPWDSKPPRPPGKDEGRRAERRSSSCAFRVLIWGKFYCKQWGYQMKRRSFGGSNTVHLSSSERFRRNGKKSTSWLAKEFTGWKCVNEATKNSAPIASRRPLLCEGFHKTRHTSTCTRTKVHRRCLARSEIRDMTMCWKNLGECSKNYLPSVRIWFSYIWTDQKKISLLSLCKVYWVYLGVAYGCRTWRTSNAMKYTSKFHTSILLFLSWTHCVVISIQTQIITGCHWLSLALSHKPLGQTPPHAPFNPFRRPRFDMHISWCCRFCWFTWCCHPWCRWIAFFLEKQPGSPNSVRSPTKRRSIMDPRRVLENQITLNSQLVGLLLVLWL